jgi:hypothetical protein
MNFSSCWEDNLMPVTVAKIGSEFQVAGDIEYWLGQPSAEVITLSADTFLVTWVDHPGPVENNNSNENDIKAQIYSINGGKIGAEFIVNTQTRDRQNAPHATNLLNGDFVITWDDSSRTLGDTSSSSIKAQIFSSNGTKIGSEFLVNTETYSHQFDPRVTTLTNGHFVVSWVDNSETMSDIDWSIKAQLFSSTGNKIGSEFIVNTEVDGNQSRPSILSLANGGFVVSWENFDSTPGNSNKKISAQLFDNYGGKVGSELFVNTQTTKVVSSPYLGALTNGGFVAVWTADNNPSTDRRGIYAQLFDAKGEKIGTEFLVNTQTDGYENLARVAVLPSGNFVVVWASGTVDDDSGYNIKAQVFSSIGEKIGSEFLVNTVTDDTQHDPSITALSADSFVVSWSDGGSSGGESPENPFNPMAQIFRLVGGVDLALTGTSEADDLVGGAGDDTLDGLGGHDTLKGDRGNDALYGGPGDDTLFGGAGSNLLDGGTGYDIAVLTDIGRRSGNFSWLPNGDGTFSHGAEIETLRGIELATFADGQMVFDENDTAAQVFRLYQAALGRTADQTGLNYWVEVILHSVPLPSAASAFLSSDEFATRYGAAIDTSEFVELLYNNALGRASDHSGKAFWVEAIDSGALSRADTLFRFSESVESRAYTASIVQVGIWDLSEDAAIIARLYDTALGRLPDFEGFQFWMNAMESGTHTAIDMVSDFMHSAEFLAQSGADAGTREFVELLYINSLQRPSESAGQTYWVNAIDTVAFTRQEAMLSFSESREHKVLTVDQVMSDNPAHFGVLFA